ncbi:hypothetical protein GGX14DRAFT_404729 [Mycena pura]|uniref:Uncharacterized protein n=1 Tax=Mycena pura TaxID=153505 RepID=A0AAD6XZS1_9AGAR|nr:hypothetical protein GGX14DRAFT_404729 [Mycena pura]
MWAQAFFAEEPALNPCLRAPLSLQSTITIRHGIQSQLERERIPVFLGPNRDRMCPDLYWAIDHPAVPTPNRVLLMESDLSPKTMEAVFQWEEDQQMPNFATNEQLAAEGIGTVPYWYGVRLRYGAAVAVPYRHLAAQVRYGYGTASVLTDWASQPAPARARQTRALPVTPANPPYRTRTVSVVDCPAIGTVRIRYGRHRKCTAVAVYGTVPIPSLNAYNDAPQAWFTPRCGDRAGHGSGRAIHWLAGPAGAGQRGVASGSGWGTCGRAGVVRVRARLRVQARVRAWVQARG